MEIVTRILLAGLLLVGSATLSLSMHADRYRDVRRRNLMLFSAMAASGAAGLIMIATGDL